MSTFIKKNKSRMELLDGIQVYGQLRQQLSKVAIFDRSYGYYALLMLFVFSGFFLTAYFIIITKSLLMLIFLGLLFSFFSVQMAGLLHDAGHRTILKSTRFNDIIGYICGFLLAMGYSSWKIKHNKHHAHPNQEDEDPDIELPLLSFTEERFLKKKGIAYFLRRYQAYFYFPIGTLVSFSTRIASIRFFIANFEKKMIWEFILMTISLFIWFVLPFFVFDLQKSLLIFFVINLSIGFYLLNVFAPNHKGMPQFAKHVKISFMDQQILTSRNIYGNWLTDFMYLGLNYQIEHHLFPNTPRNKLKKITPYVKEICQKRKLEFTQTSILQSIKIILSELHKIGSLA